MELTAEPRPRRRSWTAISEGKRGRAPFANRQTTFGRTFLILHNLDKKALHNSEICAILY